MRFNSSHASAEKHGKLSSKFKIVFFASNNFSNERIGQFFRPNLFFWRCSTVIGLSHLPICMLNLKFAITSLEIFSATRACVGHRYRRSSEAAASARLEESSVQVTTAESDGGEDRGLTGRGVYEREREWERGWEREWRKRGRETERGVYTTAVT